ncbi:hypothetical protein B0H16DRAFT_1480682 [Mycena metata]|uniref:Uncharacterized protein n=1 Tax=Mycena metata TaxID=1033252 RepID=A0AAD7MC89_9AGAR|nr:hypothetical protein B0H16DRAFT_1480682 [Mycena metata]
MTEFKWDVPISWVQYKPALPNVLKTDSNKERYPDCTFPDGTGRSTGRPSRPWQRVNQFEYCLGVLFKEIALNKILSQNIWSFLKRNEGKTHNGLKVHRSGPIDHLEQDLKPKYYDTPVYRWLAVTARLSTGRFWRAKPPTERARHPSNGCRRTVATATGGSPTGKLLLPWNSAPSL